MELTRRLVSAKAIEQATGSETLIVVAGQSLKIETSPMGEEILDEECPIGKVWSITVGVVINEADAG